MHWTGLHSVQVRVYAQQVPVPATPAQRPAPAVQRSAVGAAKESRRRAIVDSALELARTHGRDGFSVDQLAELAGVSRRTVFNYFGSLNEVLLAAHSQVMDVLISEFQHRSAATPVGDGSAASVFAEMAHLLQEIELVTPMATLARLLGENFENDPDSAQLGCEVMRRTAGHLAADATKRGAKMDQVDIDLLVHSLFDGLVVINGHWMTRTGAADTTESRVVWNELLHRLIDTVRHGYASPRAF